MRPDPDLEPYTQPQSEWEFRKFSFERKRCVVMYTETLPVQLEVNVVIAR